MKWWKGKKQEAYEFHNVEEALGWVYDCCNNKCNGHKHSEEVIGVMHDVASHPSVILFDRHLILNYYVPRCSKGECGSAKRELDNLMRYRQVRKSNKERLRRKAKGYLVEARKCADEGFKDEARIYKDMASEIISRLRQM